jgi:hypothetical protein
MWVFGIGKRFVQGRLIIAAAAFLTALAWNASAQQPDATALSKNQYEAEELRIARRSNRVEALRAYLRKYPETSRRLELLTTIAEMRRGEFTEWTIYDISNQRFPQFVKLSSIKQLGDKIAAQTRFLIDPSAPGQKFPEGSFREGLVVVDCKRPRLAEAEIKVVDPSGKVLFAYKWADPALLDLSTGASFAPGSMESATQRIVCDEGMRTTLVGKQDLAEMKFSFLSRTAAGDGGIFYALMQNELHGREREVAVLVRFDHDREFGSSGQARPDVPQYRTQVSGVRLDCADGTSTETKSEYYDSANNLIYLSSQGTAFSDKEATSPFVLLRRMVCNTDDAVK